ncbi:DNA mismatch repair protein msh6, partial [Kappamyces sp. JEL0680]
SHPLVALKYMSFYVDQESQQVTFLYKLADGKCPESYGMNVARMASIPESVIHVAETVAADFDNKHSFKTAAERSLVDLQALACFHAVMNSTGVRRIWEGLQQK